MLESAMAASGTHDPSDEPLGSPDHKDTLVAWPSAPDGPEASGEVDRVDPALADRLARLLTFLGKRAADRACTPTPAR
jgi:hypothetical protein